MHRADQIAERRKLVKRYSEDGMSVAMMAKKFGVSNFTISNDRRILGIAKRQPRTGENKAVKKRKLAGDKKREKIMDRRRFKQVAVPIGEIRHKVPAETKGTIFPDRVLTPDGMESVLKDGCSNAKIGGDVLVGHLKGAAIFTLTLEERATCPASCALWRGCYGNGMEYARRWNAGPELEIQLADEIDDACALNELVLIRLHILGDFYSFDYLKLWAKKLDQHENLHVFGFTAWPVETEIGGGVARLRRAYPKRFCIRTSGRSGKWGSFTINFPTERKRIGDAIVCPEQLESMSAGLSENGRHCGNCAACWSCDAPIVFIEH